MGKSLTEVLSFPPGEFRYWMAFYNLEPKHQQQDWHTALVCSTVANASGRYKRSLKPTDFIPKKPKRKQTVEDQIAMFKRFGEKK